ncbi:MAG: hypothetical protein Kow0022_12710 [Phycisphaerales bacterium]
MIALLITILSPALTKVRETSSRVVCASNLRQHGLGLQMYADDWRGLLPPSAFLRSGGDGPAEMMTLRLAPDERIRITRDGWDGLGILYRAEYLPTPGVFYCPSHHGDHPFEVYERQWLGTPGEIVGNYHFRGQDSDGRRTLYNMHAETALGADGMRTQEDYNHNIGINVLRAGLHVAWLDDGNQTLRMMLPDSDADPDGSVVDRAWDFLDRPQP